jgi:hypothetical protein
VGLQLLALQSTVKDPWGAVYHQTAPYFVQA